MIKNDVKNISSQCQIVFFNWSVKIPQELEFQPDLASSNALDISKYIKEVAFSKNLSAPAGTFEITLPNDRDWKDVLQRGTWGIIYMSQDGGLSIPSGSDTPSMSALASQKKKIRGIVLIDRVGVQGKVGEERGEFDADFVVSGRDFGVVYVENNIFFNKLYSEGKFQEAIGGQLKATDLKDVAGLLKIFHQGFFSPADLGFGVENAGSLLKNVPVQWLLPQKLFQALGLQPRNNAPYYGNIPGLLDNFKQTLCSYPVASPMTLVNGNAWDRLKAYSIQEFHELFPETDSNGHPRLNFRYIPWRTSDGEKLGKLKPLVQAFTSLPRVKLPAVDLISFELGEDMHSRYNYFFLTIENAMFDANASLWAFTDQSPQTGFPRIQANSIRRHGLRLMFRQIDALIIQGKEQTDPDLLMLHNELMVEYHNQEIFMENGTITIVGNPEVKLGKVLEFEANTPYNGGKLFYIEGYADHFISDDKGAGFWTQTLTLTRGITPGKIGHRGEPYTDNGEFTENK